MPSSKFSEPVESSGWLSAQGILRYEDDFRLTVDVGNGFGAFYRSLIPKTYFVGKPRWSTHITVVRAGKEEPPNEEHWGKYEGEVVTFHYDPIIRINKIYYWLNCWCDRLVEVREELGLPPKSRWTLPPDQGHQCFHITVGNTK